MDLEGFDYKARAETKKAGIEWHTFAFPIADGDKSMGDFLKLALD